MEVHLRISLELWLKRLLVSGFPKVFEIGRIFRNEGQSREHVQDYTQLESYEAFADMRIGMDFIQELYRRIAKEVYHRYAFTIHGHDVDFAADWPEISFCEVIRGSYGIDPLTCTEEEAIAAVQKADITVGEALNRARAVDQLWKVERKKIVGPAFLTGVPVYLEPLAKRTESDARIVERFQVILAGSEMGKGFSELNDPKISVRDSRSSKIFAMQEMTKPSASMRNSSERWNTACPLRSDSAFPSASSRSLRIARYTRRSFSSATSTRIISLSHK